MTYPPPPRSEIGRVVPIEQLLSLSARSHSPNASTPGNRTGRLWVLILRIGPSCTHREELPRSVNPKLSQANQGQIPKERLGSKASVIPEPD
jgi:hypothetical protein